MKQRLIIVFLALASCVKLHEPVEWRCSELAAIDSLMWRQPDSALACLLPYFDTCCRDAMIASPETPDGDFMETHAMRLYNRHYAQLLLAELLYKNDYAQTNRSELLQAVAYFDSLLTADTRGVSLQGSRRRDASHASAKTSAFLDARAHYINGVGYYENDSVVEACAEYLKALEIMENRFEAKELVGNKARFMTLTNNRLVDLFSDQFMQEPAIVCAKQSLFYDEIEHNSPYSHANILYRIGLQYDKLEEMDSAALYFEAALNAFPDVTTLVYRDLIASLALFEYKSHHDTVKALCSLKSVAAQAVNEAERLARYFTIGAIYYLEKQYDSSKVYLEPVYEKDVNRKKMAAERLRDIALKEGNTPKADMYTQVLLEDPDTKAVSKAQVSQLEGLFNNYLSKKQETQTTKEHHDAILKTSKIIIIIAIVVVAFIVILMKFRNRKKLIKVHDEEEKRHAKTLEATRQAYNREKSALSGRLKRSNQELRELKDQIKQQNSRPAENEQVVTFSEEPICILIMERVKEGRFLSQMDCTIYKDYALDKSQLSALRNAADRHFNQFTVRISKAYPELTRGDLDYCCLYLLGLTDADIAALMQRAYNTVNERNSKLRKIFGNENAISITIQGIANEYSSI